MKTPLKGIFVLLLVFCLQNKLIGQSVKVMTYNIKYDNTNDTVNNWNVRKQTLVELIKKSGASFIGTQEVLQHQLRFIDSLLPNFSYLGVGRDDGKKKGEYSPIHYDSDRFEVIENNTFWLSKTPNKISVGWDAAMERICTYGLFKDKTTLQKLWVFNTHFDHIGKKARKNSAKLILRKIKVLNTENLPVVLMGDFNLIPEERPIRLLRKKMDDGLHISENPMEGPEGTFNGFDIDDPMKKRIDYIFIKGFNVKNYIHIDERLKSGKHISDHLPVLISLSKK